MPEALCRTCGGSGEVMVDQGSSRGGRLSDDYVLGTCPSCGGYGAPRPVARRLNLDAVRDAVGEDVDDEIAHDDGTGFLRLDTSTTGVG